MGQNRPSSEQSPHTQRHGSTPRWIRQGGNNVSYTLHTPKISQVSKKIQDNWHCSSNAHTHTHTQRQRVREREGEGGGDRDSGGVIIERRMGEEIKWDTLRPRTRRRHRRRCEGRDENSTLQRAVLFTQVFVYISVSLNAQLCTFPHHSQNEKEKKTRRHQIQSAFCSQTTDAF